jgi:pilus assembly protein CpaC
MSAIRQVGRMRQGGQVGTKRWWSVLVLLIAIFGSSIIYAGGEGEGENVTLMVGRSTVLDTGKPIARVSLTSADIADALVTSANELLINGKAPGTISMFVWDRAGAIRRYEVVVQRDLAQLSERLQTLFPGETMAAHSNGKGVVLSGTVSSKEIADRAIAMAAGYTDKKDDVVSLLQVQSAMTNQVLLRVRFAEVSRSAMTELGASFVLNGYKDGRWFGRSTTQQFPAPAWDPQGKLIFSDFLNLFLYDSKEGIAGLVKALQQRGLFQSLAEPNLVAESGKEASFLAGGEIPVPIAQPSGGAVAITVQYKEFGIRLNFTPVVTGNRVHLKVRPEVSTLDFSNAVTLQGFRIPALSTRRTETELELESGQTFSIAGLLDNTMNTSLQKIPGIGDIPILGLLFKSKAAQKNQTELVVMITPEILQSGSRGVTGNLPRIQEPFLPPAPQKNMRDMPPPAFSTGRPSADASAPAPVPAAAPAPVAPAEDVANVAAKVQALTPSAPTVSQAPVPAAPSAPAKKDDEKAAKAQLKAMSVNSQRDTKLAEEQRRKDEAEQKVAAEQKKRQEKEAREEAKRDEAAAKRQAAIEKAANEAAAKRAAEEAKKQAEIEKRQQKSIDEAEARMKAAQAAYEAELGKKNNNKQ